MIALEPRERVLGGAGEDLGKLALGGLGTEIAFHEQPLVERGGSLAGRTLLELAEGTLGQPPWAKRCGILVGNGLHGRSTVRG